MVEFRKKEVYLCNVCWETADKYEKIAEYNCVICEAPICSNHSDWNRYGLHVEAKIGNSLYSENAYFCPPCTRYFDDDKIGQEVKKEVELTLATLKRVVKNYSTQKRGV